MDSLSTPKHGNKHSKRFSRRFSYSIRRTFKRKRRRTPVKGNPIKFWLISCLLYDVVFDFSLLNGESRVWCPNRPFVCHVHPPTFLWFSCFSSPTVPFVCHGHPDIFLAYHDFHSSSFCIYIYICHFIPHFSWLIMKFIAQSYCRVHLPSFLG